MDTRFNQTKLKKLQIFNGAQLKYLAFASMLIDHVNNALFKWTRFSITFVQSIFYFGQNCIPAVCFFSCRGILQNWQQNEISDYAFNFWCNIRSAF